MCVCSCAFVVNFASPVWTPTHRSRQSKYVILCMIIGVKQSVDMLEHDSNTYHAYSSTIFIISIHISFQVMCICMHTHTHMHEHKHAHVRVYLYAHTHTQR